MSSMKKITIPILIILICTLIGCASDRADNNDGQEPEMIGHTSDNDIDDPDISPETEDTPEIIKEEPDDSGTFGEDKTLIDPDGNTLQTRILVPEGYERTTEEPASLGEFLRNYKVLPDKSPVLLFDGTVKSNDHAACVFDMYLSGNDLQQCADSVMRVYAEYMRSCGKEDRIAFHFVNGFLCDWNSYKSGKRILVSGNDVSWADGSVTSDSDDNFERYLETVYMYASTLSLDKESRSVELSDIQIGDIFIKGGSPGHVVMVVDVCEKDGKKAFLLAQGYMPAQQFHVLINEYHGSDPWYYEDEIIYPFITPEYVFNEQCLKRPIYLTE
ncbi:MAG: DUF4846 domain-containing protein [Lachnospiraceae bacterium]|nr:DUF4846 domain-containing protein [Lachnospiraceae bacterium]